MNSNFDLFKTIFGRIQNVDTPFYRPAQYRLDWEEVAVSKTSLHSQSKRQFFYGPADNKHNLKAWPLSF